MPAKPTVFKIRRNLTIGATTAEVDPLLQGCFVLTAAYEAAASQQDPRCILLGRSGSGKSAVIRRLAAEKANVVRIQPQNLALQFLGGSEMLQALRKTGVHLELFYKLVWRHVFVVELIKCVFPEQTRSLGTGGLGQLLRLLGVSSRKVRERDAAAEYLDTWGTMFFQSGEHRIVELHQSLEKTLAAKLGLPTGPTSWLNALGVEAGAEASRKSSDSRHERIEIAQQVASEIQVAHLGYVVELLHRELEGNAAVRPYIVIDDLDSVWIDNELVDDLIKALMMEIYDLRGSLPEVKVVVAIRDNILHKIESGGPTRGYQREKLDAQRVRLTWSSADLISMVDSRIARVFEAAYTSKVPDHTDIFAPAKKAELSGIDYVMAGALGRPRDVIYWVNEAIQKADGRPSITLSIVQDTEKQFSEWRLRSIVDEWSQNYPSLELALDILRDRQHRFQLADWSDDDLLNLVTHWRAADSEWISDIGEALLEGGTKGREAGVVARAKLCQVLYEIGALGIISGSSHEAKFAFQDAPVLSESELEASTTVVVHRALWQCLGVAGPRSRQSSPAPLKQRSGGLNAPGRASARRR
jgi:hypothetical protein